jgi:parvulin-like peptidyl-prolyl isomerase
MTDNSNHSPSLLLVGGAIIGALLAVSGVLQPAATIDSREIAATVDGEPIYRHQYQAYIEALQRDRRNPLIEGYQRQVLDRLIDEKLLIERGLQSGIPRTDPAARKAIVDAVIEAAVAAAGAVVPAAGELEAFYRDNQAYFSSPPLLQVRRMLFRPPQALQRAGQALARLDTEPFESVRDSLADRDILALPGGLLPENRWQGYLGPAQTAALARLDVGAISQPISAGDNVYLLQLVARQETPPAPLADIRDQVLREYQRRQRDQALRDYLDDLRARADIVINRQNLPAL